MLIVLLTLAASVIAVVVLGLAAFLDVAFHPPEYSAAVAPRDRSLPPLRRQELFQWFSAMAQSLTRGLLSARRAAGIARPTAATRCGAPDDAGDGWVPESVDAVACSMTTGATPSEVLEIADYLRRTQSTVRVEEICRQAAENSRRVIGMGRMESARARIRCPLACEDGTCVAFPVQPIQCRVRCALFGHEVAWNGDAVRAKLVADGTEHGLSKALTEAGLNDGLYELNSALAKVLPSPEVAAGSASGESPFAECVPYIAALTA